MKKRDKHYVANRLGREVLPVIERYFKDRFGVEVHLTRRTPSGPILRVNGLLNPSNHFMPETEGYPPLPIRHVDRADLVAYLDAAHPGWDSGFKERRPWRAFFIPTSPPKNRDRFYTRAVRLVREDNDASPKKLMDYFTIGKQRAHSILARMLSDGVIDAAGNVLPFNISELYT